MSHSSGNISYDFSEKNILVTGGAQGIGRQIVEDFLAAGAQVVVWDYSPEAVRLAQSELSQISGAKDRVHFEQVDVSKLESCQAAAKKLPFKLDVLVNNAGITRDKSFVKMEPADWDAVIQTNLTGVFNVTKSVFDRFKTETSHRRIINLASIVALHGNFGQTNYVAAKAGVIGMTKTWAREFGKKGFTVNAIAPGFIVTALTQKMPKEAIDSMVSKIPAARMGQTRDIANACLFLSSDAASYINGALLQVDGGLVV